ncbi:MAG: hypothetical protein HY657_15330 [Acidobacteria bacterium]|nr:hypothetical protein [Acidobacteriota bacterium]
MLWLTLRGALERTFSFDDSVSFGAGDYRAPWGITDFEVDERTGVRRVAVSAHHYTWWPSLVTVLDDGWRRRGTFVHAGWIERVHWLSAERLLVLGFSEALDGGMAAILDVNDLDGQSPAPPDSPFFCANCGTGRPLRYIVMPRSEVNRASSSRFNRARADPVGEHFVVRTIEVPQGVGDAADALYEFSPSFDLLSASFSSRYWEIHRTLEEQGKIAHSREECPDRDGPREILVWEPGAGWNTLTAR